MTRPRGVRTLRSVEPGFGYDPLARNETALERCDRNLVELMQEVRVVQTGVQVLFAFLLTAPLAPLATLGCVTCWGAAPPLRRAALRDQRSA